MILFQVDHRACQRTGVASFRPAFIAFALAGSQLYFNVNQALDLAFRHPASGAFGDMHMLSGKQHAQCFFRVLCANRIQPDKALCAGRLDADLRAALNPAACFLQQLHQRIEALRLHPKRSVNHHPQHVTLGCFGVLAEPLVISDRLVFWFPDDGELVFFADLIAQLSQRLA